MSLARIPLFPLEVVLFPRAPLPLHIFEPRYKLMIRRCVDQHDVFGVLLARSEGICPVAAPLRSSRSPRSMKTAAWTS
jgi:Lon protease-like protein